MGAILFFTEKTKFKIDSPRKTSNWIKKVIKAEGRELSSLNVIFCNDEFLLEINEGYLNHKTLTDIITFDNSESKKYITGEIYISIPRIRENAAKFNTSFDSELHRVLIHGVLHLLGYNDKGASQKAIMRNKEDSYLSLRT